MKINGAYKTASHIIITDPVCGTCAVSPLIAAPFLFFSFPSITLSPRHSALSAVADHRATFEELETLTPALIGCHRALRNVRPLAGYNHVYMAAASAKVSRLRLFRKSFTVETAGEGKGRREARVVKWLSVRDDDFLSQESLVSLFLPDLLDFLQETS